MGNTKEPNVFHIGDTHFYDDGIIRIENRPFKTADEMNQTIITAWNSKVGKDDIVWHHGDVGSCNWYGVTTEYVIRKLHEVIMQLNGHKYLIMGNHDRNLTEAEWKTIGFEKVYDYPVLYKDWFVLSHEPIYVSCNMPYANIFAHVHGNPNFNTVSKAGACISCERWNHAPVESDSLICRIRDTQSGNGTKDRTGRNAIQIMEGYAKTIATRIGINDQEAFDILDSMLDLTQAIVRSAAGDTVFHYKNEKWYHQLGHPVTFLDCNTKKWIYGTICAGYNFKNGYVTCKEDGTSNPLIVTFPDWQLDHMFKNPLVHENNDKDGDEE